MRLQQQLRLGVVWILVGACYALISYRLFRLQIDQDGFLADKAAQQYQTLLTIPAARGPIYDRTGKTQLVFNEEVLSACFIPRQAKQDKATLKILKTDYPKSHQLLVASSWSNFVWLERHLAPDRANQLQSLAADITLLPESRRVYPYAHCNHLVGFTDIDTVGVAGFERHFNTELSGAPGKARVHKDARRKGCYFGQEIIKEPNNGAAIRLSVDERLQRVAYHAVKERVDDMKAQCGSAVIMDPDNGEVLAMVSYPGFDAHAVTSTGIALSKNIPVTECFECGSVIKAFLALAGLSEKVVTPDTLIDCEGHGTMINGIRVEHRYFTEEIPFSEVIQKSNNVGVAKVAVQLGPKLHEHYARLGLGKKTQIEFPGERKGFLNPPERWSAPTPVAMSFGYELSVSFIQLAKAFSIIANGGYDIRPTFIPGSSTKGAQLYDSETIVQLKDILEPIGVKHGVPGYRVMGKTGTARLVKDGAYSTKHHIYSFAGIIEKDQYRRVVITMIKEPEKQGLWSSQVAAPLFQTIAHQMTAIEQG